MSKERCCRPTAADGFGVLAAFGGLVGLYWRFVRPKVLNWGTKGEESMAELPGDQIVPGRVLQTTRAIWIDAPPERVWPWLVQIGPRPRAGIYTYDWLERMLGIDIENSDRILPEFQHLEAGEFFSLNDKGTGLRVVDVAPARSLVLQWEPSGGTWAFVLRPDGTGTRMLSRNRIPGSGPGFRSAMAVMEPASLVMEWTMLHGFKERAEREAL